MARKKFKAIRPHQAVLTQSPYVKGFLDTLDALSGEKGHRGSVVLSCAYLDDLLAEILDAFFVDTEEARGLTDGFSSPLGTFSARITAAHALALIDDFEFKDLNTIRGIRNDFAHKRNASFDLQSIKDRCGNLECKAPERPSRPNKPFGRFSTAVVTLLHRFANRADEVRKIRLQPRAWRPAPTTFKTLVEQGIFEDEPIGGKKRARRAKSTPASHSTPGRRRSN